MFRSRFVSPPVAETVGPLPVAALVTDISFTAEPVFTNLMYSLFESSSNAPPLSMITSLPFVSNTPDNCGVMSDDKSVKAVSTTLVTSHKTIFVVLSVAAQVTPVPEDVLNVTV